MPEVSVEAALLGYKLAYLGLILGAVFVLCGTLLLFWADGELKRHDDLRISANEAETARARESAAFANALAAQANGRAGRARREAAQANERAEKLKAENLALQGIIKPRRLPTGGGFQEKYDELKKYAGTPVAIFVVPDFASRQFANDIWNVLRIAGWKIEDAHRVDDPLFTGLNIFSGAVTESGPLPPKNPDNAWLAGAALADLMTAWKLGRHGGTLPVSHSPEAMLPPDIGAYKRPEGSVAITIGLPDIQGELTMMQHFGAPVAGEPKQ